MYVSRYAYCPGPTSPPFPGHAMTDGQVIRREDWFPFLLT
jgi:hypothetical protein